MRELTSTSYAILGLLAVRPWSAYELTNYMMTSAIRGVWARVESKLYEEPKKLVEHGYATAAKEQVGGRARTVYTITPAGRSAVGEWLQEPAAGWTVEWEAMLKVIHAPLGDQEQVLHRIESIRTGAIENRRRFVELFTGMVESGPYLPERFHTNILMAKLALDIERLAEAWANWALKMVGDWPSTEPGPETVEWATGQLEEILAGEG